MWRNAPSRSTGWMSETIDSTVIRFVVTGGGAAALFFVLSIAFLTAGAPPFWGSLAAYAIAFLASYLVQRGWTFRGLHRHGHALPRYLILQLGCALSSAAAAQALDTLFAASVLLTSFIATGFAGVVSYVLSANWVFSDGRKSQINNIMLRNRIASRCVSRNFSGGGSTCVSFGAQRSPLTKQF